MSGRKRDSKTAEELIAELEAAPDFAARRDEQERERRRLETKWRRAEVPLIKELRNAGFEIDSVWDLVNSDDPYPEALPILLEHLQRPYPDRVREGIARALAVRDAMFSWDVLKRLYEEEPEDSDAKEGLAVAMAAASNDEVLEDVIALATDARHGKSRVLLLRALERSREPRAKKALSELSGDPQLAAEVRRIGEGLT